MPSLNESLWQDAISEAIANVPGGPDFNDDFSPSFRTSRIDKALYDEMFTSLLEPTNE